MPSSLDLETALQVCLRLSTLQDDEITFNFRNTGNVEPFGLLMVSSEISRLKQYIMDIEQESYKQKEFLNKLEQIANLDGMPLDKFRTCMKSKSLQDQILNHRMDAAKSLQLKSTPSFFINGEISEGYVDYLSLKKIIEKELVKK